MLLDGDPLIANPFRQRAAGLRSRKLQQERKVVGAAANQALNAGRRMPRPCSATLMAIALARLQSASCRA
jgi:hypothetical protein